MNAKPARKIIEMAMRRAKPGSGSQPFVVRDPSASYGSPLALKDILKRTPYVIVGGLATRLYMQERMTLDADILVHEDDGALVEEELCASGALKKGPLTTGGSTWELPNKTTLDVIVLNEPWVADAIAACVQSGDGMPYVDLPYLVLMKLESSRSQDLADVSRMLGAAGSKTLDRVRDVIRRHLPADLDDLESLIRLGKLESET